MRAAPPKILIADDDEGIIDATVMFLEIMGYDVTSTLNGEQATSMVNAATDLIILDVWMAGTDGRDVCKLLKADPTLKHIPILMISASKANRDSTLASGADYFMEKPFDMDELIERIEILIAN